MPEGTAASADTTPDLTVPRLIATQPRDVRDVIPLPGYRLAVRFYDGTSGIVDLSARVAARESGVFAALRKRAVFDAVRVELGAVSWPSGADLAPDVMHAELSARGEWRLE